MFQPLEIHHLAHLDWNELVTRFKFQLEFLIVHGTKLHNSRKTVIFVSIDSVDECHLVPGMRGAVS